MKRRRADGRTAWQLRTLDAELGGVRGCDGSARLCCGDTLVLVSVHGPRPAPARLEDADGAALEVSVTVSASGGGVAAAAGDGAGGDGKEARARARGLEAFLRAALAPAVARACAESAMRDEGAACVVRQRDLVAGGDSEVAKLRGGSASFEIMTKMFN